MSDPTPQQKLSQQSAWYGARARHSRFWYVALKTTQIVFAAAIPVVALAAAGDAQKWTTAILGASIGVLEGLIQLGQYQQNWLLYRATREALKREELLYGAKAGPYAGAPEAERLYFERCDSIISGENAKWLASQEQAGSKKADGKG